MNCEKYRLKLMDIFYGEAIEGQDISLHLESCESCRQFKESLYLIDKEAASINFEPEMDERIIRGAFSKAQNIQHQKKNIKDLGIFIAISSMIIALIILISYAGNTLAIMKFQLVIGFICPAIIPFVIKRKLSRGEY